MLFNVSLKQPNFNIANCMAATNRSHVCGGRNREVEANVEQGMENVKTNWYTKILLVVCKFCGVFVSGKIVKLQLNSY
jgi:hypothetical protein